MSPTVLPIPSDLLQNKSLTSNQKLILSLTSTKDKFYGLEIAKSLGTKRSQIQNDLDTLVSQGFLASSNGQGRIAYSLQDGSYVVNTQQNIDIAVNSAVSLKRLTYTSERSEEVYKTCKQDITARPDPRPRPPAYKELLRGYAPAYKELLRGQANEQVDLAYEYWGKRGFRKHREGTAVLKESLHMLSELFTGQAFKHVPETVIPDPLLNKTRVFSLEDFQTSLDNYIMSIESPAHYPTSKTAAIKFRKNLSLSQFIYNKFAYEGSARSLFLKYLQPPQLIHREISINPKLSRQLELAFDRSKIRYKPNQSQIITASNTYNKLLQNNPMPHVPVADKAELLVTFIEKEIGLSKFEPHWVVSGWLHIKFEKWLNRQGYINLNEE